MTLPPGFARLAINPIPTGSPTVTRTIGIVAVARLAAIAAWAEVTTMALTGRPTSSTARFASRSTPPLREAILDGEVLSFRVSELSEPFPKSCDEVGVGGLTGQTEPADPSDPRRLSPCGNRRSEEREGEGQSSQRPSASHLVTVPQPSSRSPTSALTGRGERMRASGPVERVVRLRRTPPARRGRHPTARNERVGESRFPLPPRSP